MQKNVLFQKKIADFLIKKVTRMRLTNFKYFIVTVGIFQEKNLSLESSASNFTRHKLFYMKVIDSKPTNNYIVH